MPTGHGIDAALAGVPLDPVWRDEVEKVSHRHYSTGFFYGQPGQFTQDAGTSGTAGAGGGPILHPTGLATASLRNKFAQGDPIELVGPGLRPVAFQAPLMADAEGEALPEPRHPQMTFQIQLPCYAPPLSFLRPAGRIRNRLQNRSPRPWSSQRLPRRGSCWFAGKRPFRPQGKPALGPEPARRSYRRNLRWKWKVSRISARASSIRDRTSWMSCSEITAAGSKRMVLALTRVPAVRTFRAKRPRAQA